MFTVFTLIIDAHVHGPGLVQFGGIRLGSGNTAEEMIGMITAQRAYEINSKAVKTSEEMLQIAANLKR